jgi:hypothetical protein
MNKSQQHNLFSIIIDLCLLANPLRAGVALSLLFLAI